MTSSNFEMLTTNFCNAFFIKINRSSTLVLADFCVFVFLKICGGNFSM